VPELAAIAKVGVECVLDGEVVTGAGLPADFYRLAGVVSVCRRSSMLTFVAFDVLYLTVVACLMTSTQLDGGCSSAWCGCATVR
jgi:ATP-dependent DNA ligase